jgi:hypothetical protein
MAGIRILSVDENPVPLLGAAPGAFFVLGLIWWIIKAASAKAGQNTLING